MVANSSAICILPERFGMFPGVVARPVEGMTLSRTICLVTVSGSGTPKEVRQIFKLATTYDWSAKNMAT